MNGNGLSVVLKNCEKFLSTDKELIDFISIIVQKVKMVKLGKPMIEIGNKKLPGKSIIQMIETSHITLHTFSKTSSYMFSIESCKRFKANILKDYLQKFFKPKEFIVNAEYEINV